MSRLISKLVRFGRLRVEFYRRRGARFRRRHWPAGRDQVHRPLGALGVIARSRTEARRTLHGRASAGYGGRSLRSARCSARQTFGRAKVSPGSRRWSGCATASSAGRPATIAAARARTSPRITISTTGYTIFFSTPTGNIPAPTSSTPISRSTRPSSPRSAISPPSCWSTNAIACSTSAAASAAWGSISPARPARASAA